MVGAPELDAELVGGTLVLAATLLSAPALLGLALEAAVLAWTDRVERRPVLAGALGLMALATVVASAAEHPLVLAVALGVWGTAAGVAEGIAEAALVSGTPTGGDASDHAPVDSGAEVSASGSADSASSGSGSASSGSGSGPADPRSDRDAADPPDPARAMTRWGIAGAVGDLVAPILLGAALAAGLGWRGVMLATAALPALDALLVASGPRRSTAPDEDEEPEEPFRTALARVLTDRTLLGWVLAATACTLLDELLVALAALRLEALGASPGLRGAELAALALGGATGLFATERWLGSAGTRRVLLAACALTIGALAAWLAAGAAPVGIGFAALVGAGVSPMWPLAKAAAFARCPDRPGLVGAVDRLFGPLELAAPVLIGWIADRWGLEAALASLLVQPIVVGATAALAGARPRAGGGGGGATPR